MSTSALQHPLQQNNLNQHWKNLDAIFQSSLRKYVLEKNRSKFHTFAKELGFNETQSEFLWESIEAFTLQCISRNQSVSPFPSHATVVSRSSSSHFTTASKGPLYAIPNNQNQNLHPLKRQLSTLLSSDSDELSSSSDEEMETKTHQRKKRKTTNKQNPNGENEIMSNLWQEDKEMSKAKQRQLEDEGIFIVKEIVDHKKIGTNKYQYNVTWEGYEDATWEPFENIGCHIVDHYWDTKGAIKDKESAMNYWNARNKAQQQPIKTKTAAKKKRQRSNTQRERQQTVHKEFKCIPCNKTFKNAFALGGHKSSKTCKKNREEFEQKQNGSSKNSTVYWEDSEGSSDDDSKLSMSNDGDLIIEDSD